MRLALCSLLLLATACPGRIEDPSRFEGDSAGACALDVERVLLPTSCGGGGCHGASSPAGQLDLESPGVAGRLLGVKSTCADRPLVSAGGSYLIDKLNAQPACGSKMPVGFDLTDYERNCLEQYVQGLIDGAAR